MLKGREQRRALQESRLDTCDDRRGWRGPGEQIRQSFRISAIDQHQPMVWFNITRVVCPTERSTGQVVRDPHASNGFAVSGSINLAR
ncbi:MAG: hypothetical protein HYZ53_04775 [Planctomycetes bacterium]|nr:hypothetical protein [Planctomycetota bacterium]